MKSTGMTRPLDNLGRIVIPKEMRETMGIDIGDPLEIFVDKDSGMLAFRQYIGVACKTCGSIDRLLYFKDSFICSDCAYDLKEGKISPKISNDKISKVEKPKRRIYQKPEIMLKKLNDLMLEHPSYTQKQYAEILGVSQCRVSQLKGKLREQ
ncbi:AbrB/MazE/SpoVT family DNA-binding domain-containing protein [Paenibacillus sp. Mc5Re-14]|uniref:AbrB/MazE/SpoVT family DNA-binding domain-containing protein n=1 Tax=Paenibacillus sp. Mc5Re-14 TaxID=1030529 RepID=UPI000A7A8A6F|nr:AbrB/MazE/SpoVT family DNA-binding domain-containing protein [Paenibacillus sp. Mc5Re-14]